jgi:hypothetical protein
MFAAAVAENGGRCVAMPKPPELLETRRADDPSAAAPR